MKIILFILAACMQSLASLASDSLVLVLNKTANTLAFIDTREMKTVATLPTGEGPHEIVISEDKSVAYVANYGHNIPGNSIDIFDIRKKEFLKRIDLGALRRPHGLAEKGGKLYFTAELNRAVGQYDHREGKITGIIGTGESISHMIAITPDGNRVYTANILSNSVTMLDVAKPPLPDFVRQIKVGMKPEAIAVSPDGREVWVGHNDDGTISVIETAGHTVSATFSTGKMPIRIIFSSDGKHAYVSDPPADEIQVVNVASRKVIRRITVPGAPVGISISADNRYLFVAQTKSDQVSKIDLSDHQIVATAATGKNPDGIAVVYF